MGDLGEEGMQCWETLQAKRYIARTRTHKGRPPPTRCFRRIRRCQDRRSNGARRRGGGDGTVVTPSGIFAGIGRLYGREIAAWMERFTEYDAYRDPNWDPFNVKGDWCNDVVGSKFCATEKAGQQSCPAFFMTPVEGGSTLQLRKPDPNSPT